MIKNIVYFLLVRKKYIFVILFRFIDIGGVMLHFSPQQLFDILLIPICIQIGALVLGYFFNRLIERYLHKAIDGESWQFIFVNAVRGLPISWCSGVGLYWTINSIDNIPPTVSRLLSSLLFSVIVFTLTRVIARTLTGISIFILLVLIKICQKLH